MIMDKEDGTIFTEALELHYINMKAFAKAVNEADSINIQETHEDMFAYWLSIITEKEIVNKEIIDNARKEKEVIRMAISAIARQSEDKIIRQAYQRRKDEIFFHNAELAKNLQIAEQYRQQAEQSDRRAEQDRQRAEQSDRRAEKAEAENELLRKRLAELEAK